MTKKIPTSLLLSVISSVLLILIQLFRWTLVDMLTPFLEPLIEIPILIFFFVSFIWAIVHTVKQFKISKKRALTPLLINICTLLIVIFVPFTNIVLYLDFKINYAERQEVVSLVESGEIEPDAWNGLTSLPPEYDNLSNGGGEIVVFRDEDSTAILFYTYRGVVDNFAGFVYTTNGAVEELRSLDADFIQVKKIDEHWYWVSAT